MENIKYLKVSVESKINNDFKPIGKEDILNVFCNRCLEKFTIKII
jgi:hypothetical protein